jgi:sugar O-acyltransferase (sialic acid O-acetyltransferase NeuD family)
MNNIIYILGIGNNTSVYIDLIENCGYEIGGLYHYNDSKTGTQLHGYDILDSTENLFNKSNLNGMNFSLSMGDNQIRNNLYHKILSMGGSIPTLIHPQAVVSKYSHISNGVVVHANSVIQADVNIDENTIISFNVSVAHTSKIGKSCYLSFGCSVGAYVDVQDFCFIGQSASIISGKVSSIGKNSLIGAGAVVICDVNKNTTVIGNPAKIL